jgi:hypothetical protein
MIHGSVVFVGDEPQFKFQEIFLNVRPFSEAFNIDVINMLQEMGKKRFEFFDEIDLDQEEDMNDDERLLKNLAESYSISDDSIKIAKELLV